MEAQVKAGRTRSIGISNFNESQILNILNSAEIKPSNLQVCNVIYIKYLIITKLR
jgi:alcohol dehydrogenase (NADP+)